MLQSIRDHTHGWIAGTIVSLLILSFALWGIHSYMEGSANTAAVAKVNGIEITQNQLNTAYERSLRQLQMQYGSDIPLGAEANLKNRALQTLIDLQVLKQASLEQNYRISSHQVDNYLESIPEFQVDGQFSATRFQQLLTTTLFSARDFLDLIQASLLIDQPRLGLIFTSFAVPNEVASTIELVGQERDIRYAVLPFSYFANQPITISNDKIVSYYKSHEGEFKTLEQVSVDYIELSVKDLMSQLSTDEQKMKDFYKENIASYTKPAQWKIEAVLIPVAENAPTAEVDKAKENANKLIINGKNAKDFTSLAHSFSAVKGNDVLQGWITIDKIPAELQQYVLELKKPNQITAPIRTKDGFIIVKADDLKPAMAQSYEEVKQKIHDVLSRQSAQQKFAELKDKLANITYEHPDSLAQASQKLGLNVKTSELFTKEKGGKDISFNAKVREAAYSDDVLNLKNNSDLIQVDPDTLVVLRIKSHASAALLSMDSVEKQITDKLKASEVEARTAQLSEEIKNKLLTGSSPEAIAAQYHLNWSNVGFIGRHSNKVSSAILDTAFAMSKSLQENKPTYASTKVADGYAVVALVSVKSPAQGNEKDQYKVFAEQIQNSQGLLEYELYKQSLVKKANIVMQNQ